MLDAGPRYATVTADLLREHAAALGAALARVASAHDRDAAHDARIAAKRLRYLLEPFDVVLPRVNALVGDLTALQDTLGALHDAQLFGSQIAEIVASVRAVRAAASPGTKGRPRVRRPTRARLDDQVRGLDVLLRRLREAEATAFATFQSSWAGDAVPALLTRVASVEAAFKDIAKGAREIERKYLLRKLPRAMPPATTMEIQQGYLPGTRLVERIRSMAAPDGTRYFRTVKLGVGLDRIEIEEESDGRVFKALWPLTTGRRVHKRRHRVETDGLAWEIDEYLDRKLVVAEVELESPSDAPPLPDWLTAVMDRDVTDDDRYGNRRLAQ